MPVFSTCETLKTEVRHYLSALKRMERCLLVLNNIESDLLCDLFITDKDSYYVFSKDGYKRKSEVSVCTITINNIRFYARNEELQGSAKGTKV